MTSHRIEVSVKGTRRLVGALALGPRTNLLVRGRFLKTAEIHDAFWLSRADIPPPERVIAKLRASRQRADIYTFAERPTDVASSFPYAMQLENLAVARFESYREWFEDHVNRSVRKHLRKADREGIVAEAVPFSDALVSGITAIYNEVPVRQGRPFWHYGKSVDQARAANTTFLDRSVFIAATCHGELVGFLKFVIIEPGIAAIMQVLSKISHVEKRPTNALLAKAVEECAARRITRLIYGEYAYGSKQDSSLIDFKRNNGFFRVDVPRYYVPLTRKGDLALRYGLNRQWTDAIPPRMRAFIAECRSRWHRGRSRVAQAPVSGPTPT